MSNFTFRNENIFFCVGAKKADLAALLKQTIESQPPKDDGNSTDVSAVIDKISAEDDLTKDLNEVESEEKKEDEKEEKVEEETLDIQAGDDFKTEPDKEDDANHIKTERPDDSDRKSDNEGMS